MPRRVCNFLKRFEGMKNNKFISPLGRAKGLGGTSEGVHHWLKERIAALILLPLVVWVVYSIINLKNAAYADFLMWIEHPVNAILMMAFVLVSSYHAAYGLQVILEDYVRSHFKRMTAIVFIKVFFSFLAAASVFSILKVAL
jgi:succinate dehydrogenase / fumarate reductase, membrane anchor subunit